MMDVHIKADPVILTFTNPVSAYHALEPFEEWATVNAANYNIYNISGPRPPVDREYGFGGIGGLQVWSDIYPPTGEIGYVPSWDETIIYENRKTISCKYRTKSVIQSRSFSFYHTARQIIIENKKRQGFRKFEAWVTAIQVEQGIPLAWGPDGSDKSARMWWTPELEQEWM
jgi:hypothetical protein